MLYPEDSFELDVNPGLFLALSHRSDLETLSGINGATRYPPPSLFGLIDCQVLPVERVSADDQRELNSLKYCSLTAIHIYNYHRR